MISLHFAFRNRVGLSGDIDMLKRGGCCMDFVLIGKVALHFYQSAEKCTM